MDKRNLQLTFEIALKSPTSQKNDDGTPSTKPYAVFNFTIYFQKKTSIM